MGWFLLNLGYFNLKRLPGPRFSHPGVIPALEVTQCVPAHPDPPGLSLSCLGSRGDTRGSQRALPLPLPLKQGRLCGRGRSCHLGGNAAVGNVGIEERVTSGPAPAPFSQLLEGEGAQRRSVAQCPAGAMGTGVSPGNPEDGTWLLIPGSGAVHLQAPKLHREGSVPSVPPTPDWDGLTNLPPWNKSTISLWVRVSTERSGMAPGSSSSGGGGGSQGHEVRAGVPPGEGWGWWERGRDGAERPRARRPGQGEEIRVH